MRLTFKTMIVALIVVLIMVWFWNSYRSTTFEVVRILEVSKNEMRVINLEDRERIIVVPIDIAKIIDRNREYAISYHKRLFDKYRLKKIE